MRTQKRIALGSVFTFVKNWVHANTGDSHDSGRVLVQIR